MLGYATTIIPRAVTHYVSSFLFAAFGLKMIKDGKHYSFLTKPFVILFNITTSPNKERVVQKVDLLVKVSSFEDI